MKDLTEYGSSELSLMVFNDEYFYNERKDVPYLIALVDEQFKYTDEQMVELKQDLADDEEES